MILANNPNKKTSKNVLCVIFIAWLSIWCSATPQYNFTLLRSCFTMLLLLTSFRNTCLFKGFSEEYTFALYINGKDWNENPVPLQDFLERGVELKQLLDVWLSKW